MHETQFNFSVVKKYSDSITIPVKKSIEVLVKIIDGHEYGPRRVKMKSLFEQYIFYDRRKRKNRSKFPKQETVAFEMLNSLSQSSLPKRH